MTWGLLRRLPRSPQRSPSGWLTIGRKYDEDAWHGRARDRKTAMLHFFLPSSAHDLSPFFINNLSLPLEYYILFFTIEGIYASKRDVSLCDPAIRRF